jgi:hypothetical protein
MTLYTSSTVLSFHPTKIACIFFIFPIRATFLAHVTVVNTIPINIRWEREITKANPPLASCLLGLNFTISPPLLNTPEMFLYSEG